MKGKPPSEPGGVIREIEVSVEFFERKEFILLLAYSQMFFPNFVISLIGFRVPWLNRNFFYTRQQPSQPLSPKQVLRKEFLN